MIVELLTPLNVRQYVGFEIIFKTNNEHVIKRIIDISDSGKTIKIDYPRLNNNLEIVSRNVYVIVE